MSSWSAFLVVTVCQSCTSSCESYWSPMMQTTCCSRSSIMTNSWVVRSDARDRSIQTSLCTADALLTCGVSLPILSNAPMVSSQHQSDNCSLHYTTCVLVSWPTAVWHVRPSRVMSCRVSLIFIQLLSWHASIVTSGMFMVCSTHGQHTKYVFSALSCDIKLQSTMWANRSDFMLLPPWHWG